MILTKAIALFILWIVISIVLSPFIGFVFAWGMTIGYPLGRD